MLETPFKQGETTTKEPQTQTWKLYIFLNQFQSGLLKYCSTDQLQTNTRHMNSLLELMDNSCAKH